MTVACGHARDAVASRVALSLTVFDVAIPLKIGLFPPCSGGKEHAIEPPRVTGARPAQNSILTGSSELIIEYASKAFRRCAGRPIGLGNPTGERRQFKHSNLLSTFIMGLFTTKGKRTVRVVCGLDMLGGSVQHHAG